MSLRTRLLAGTLLLLTLALAGIDTALFVTFDRYVTSREKLELESTYDWVSSVTAGTTGPPAPTPDRSTPYASSITEVLLLDRAGKPVGVIEPIGGFSATTSSPLLPLVERNELGTWESTVEVDGHSLRVLSMRLDDLSPTPPWLGQVVITLDRGYNLSTLHEFLVRELIASGAVLVGVAVLSLLVIRIGLRPVRAIARAAGTVAAGDREQRIPVPKQRDEIGRLAVVLNQAFDQRRTAEDQLRRFVADASHELRTPLTTIRGWADLYFQDGLPEPNGVETAMTRIAEKSAEVGVLVEDLLLLAHLDERRSFAREPVDVAALAAEVCADARVLDADRPLTLDAPGPAVVPGDPDQLRQVVRNLVGNAFQHTPAGTAVRVTTTVQGDDVVLTVADDGPGVPDDDRDRLFERFYRAGHSGADTLTVPRVGAGLGLAIVRAVVERHGGTVTLEPGPGATFVVRLPREA